MTRKAMRYLALVVTGLLLLSGCAAPTIEPDRATSVEPSASVQSDPPSDTPEPEPSDSSAKPEDEANFQQEYTYTDGLEIRVSKIVNGKFTDAQARYSDEVDPGDPYTRFTVRVKNGTGATVELSGYMTVTYGPEGTEAESSYLLDDDSSLDGKLPKGRSRSATETYLIPVKHRKDVVLEVALDWDHDSAVFSGSTL